MPVRWSHPRSRVKNTRGRHHRYAEHAGIPRAMALRLIRALLGVPGLLAPVARDIDHELDPSVGGSGPHDFAVRNAHHSSVDAVAAIASRPTFRDDWP
jgi:hypothetical protein